MHEPGGRSGQEYISLFSVLVQHLVWSFLHTLFTNTGISTILGAWVHRSDGHNSHGSLDLISSLRSHGIHLLRFPSHTKAVLPPLDISLKEDLEEVLQTHDWNVDCTVFQSLIGQCCRTYFSTSFNSTTSLFSYNQKWLNKLQGNINVKYDSMEKPSNLMRYQVCKIHFDNDSEDHQAEGIWYSGCWRWSHYDYAGFKMR